MHRLFRRCSRIFYSRCHRGVLADWNRQARSEERRNYLPSRLMKVPAHAVRPKQSAINLLTNLGRNLIFGKMTVRSCLSWRRRHRLASSERARHPRLFGNDFTCNAAVYFKLSESSLFTDQIDDLGHLIQHGSLALSHPKTKTIGDLHIPKNLSKFRFFFGFCHVWPRIMSNVSRLAAPITKRLQKGPPYCLKY